LNELDEHLKSATDEIHMLKCQILNLESRFASAETALSHARDGGGAGQHNSKLGQGNEASDVIKTMKVEECAFPSAIEEETLPELVNNDSRNTVGEMIRGGLVVDAVAGNSTDDAPVSKGSKPGISAVPAPPGRLLKRHNAMEPKTIAHTRAQTNEQVCNMHLSFDP